MTTTQRCGYHRYSSVNYKNKPLDLYLMSSYLLQNKAKRYAKTTKCGGNCIEGKIWSAGSFGGRFGGYNVYFHMEWNSNDEN